MIDGDVLKQIHEYIELNLNEHSEYRRLMFEIYSDMVHGGSALYSRQVTAMQNSRDPFSKHMAELITTAWEKL